MRALEGQGHLLWALGAGPAETCPGASEHLELPGRSTPVQARLAARPGQSRLAKVVSCPGAGKGAP